LFDPANTVSAGGFFSESHSKSKASEALEASELHVSLGHNK